MTATTDSRKRALVTGGTGFIGSHLVGRLMKDGWKTDLLIPPNVPLGALQDIESQLGIHVLDGSTEQVCSIVSSCRPDVVFHLASLFLASHEVGHVEPLIRSNVLFGTQIAEATAKLGPHRLVNVGTSWQHFEGRNYSPVCLYAATKQAFEDVLVYYVEVCGLQVVTLKLYDTYGPEDFRPKLLSLLREAAQTATKLQMSAGEQLIDLVYIDDIVEALLVAAQRLLNGRVQAAESYAVCSGILRPLREVVEIYERITGYKVDVEWGARPYRLREVMVPWSGPPLPGWTSRTSLEDGIRRMECLNGPIRLTRSRENL